MVAETLLANGHRDRIALIGRNRQKERDPEISLAADARLRGIRDTLAAAGVSLLAEGFCPEWLPEHGYTAMRTLLERPTRPSAVICMNDRLAFGAYQALGEAGLTIPGDLSVISFDDDPIAAWLRPGLSTAALPHEQMGRARWRCCSTAVTLPRRSSRCRCGAAVRGRARRLTRATCGRTWPHPP